MIGKIFFTIRDFIFYGKRRFVRILNKILLLYFLEISVKIFSRLANI